MREIMKAETEQRKENDYEVYLSFRGPDTRDDFVDYLYTSFIDAEIRVFRDEDELHFGEEIGAKLLNSLIKSKISIPIISEGYVFSHWCLRELTLMLQCKERSGQIVLPIFYKVEPADLRRSVGRIGEAINAHRKKQDKMLVEEWVQAIHEVASLKGWHVKGHEGALVKEVVETVIRILNRTFPLTDLKKLVGIDDRVEQIMDLTDVNFNDTRIIGIWGVGGIGKTTLARVLYNNLSSHFKYHSFVANIRETSLHKGIECLQKQLIDDILRCPIDVSTVDDGIGFIKSRFICKKILILLDDVDANNHLNALAGDTSWFKAGSIVIITTRNKSILDEARADCKYELKRLSLEQSLTLFNRNAFQKDYPRRDYEIISNSVVSTTGSLPLTLEIIGSSLHEKSTKVWNDTLKKLKEVLNRKVQEILRISYEVLDRKLQQIFLDIAYFFMGSSIQSPTYMWDACNFFPRKEIEVLSRMSLIKIDKDDKLMMHDQLRDLGREIVRLENSEERSRLWIYEEAVDMLDSNKVRVSSLS